MADGAALDAGGGEVDAIVDSVASGDGWGVGQGVLACGPVAPPTATQQGDCCDSDPAAKPGVGGWYTAANQCGSFDYNCDGSEQKESGVAVACSIPQFQCLPLTCPAFGWFDGVPACGQSGLWGQV